MTLEDGARTVVHDCLNVQEDETVCLVNDGNDPDIIEALKNVISEVGELDYREYPEPETKGTEPPEEVAEAMKQADLFIAPTVKSISHTRAREEANEAGVRGATLPGIDKEIWNSSLQADYRRVEEITDKAYSELEDGMEIRIQTPSGTDISFTVRMESFFTDTGILHDDGDMGNLPAGEVHGGVIDMNGTLVIDHFPQAPSGTKVKIENSRVVDIEHPEGVDESELSRTLDRLECGNNIAEFGFGTNPEATLIGRTLQDEKVLGTVHVAFGDNGHYFEEAHDRYTQCDIHWDSVCEDATVYFGEKLMLDQGEPVFLDR
jgi:leucyl aminopeptidase (aminopeptidase T)